MKQTIVEKFVAENGYRITGVKIIKSNEDGGEDDRMVTIEKDVRKLVIDAALFDEIKRMVSPVKNPVTSSPVKAVG